MYYGWVFILRKPGSVPDSVPEQGAPPRCVVSVAGTFIMREVTHFFPLKVHIPSTFLVIIVASSRFITYFTILYDLLAQVGRGDASGAPEVGRFTSWNGACRMAWISSLPGSGAGLFHAVG